MRLFKLGCCGILCSLLWSHDWPCQLLIQAHTWLSRWRPVQPGYKHKVPLTISALSRKCVGLLGRDTLPDERGAATVFGSLQNCDHIWGHFCSSVFSLIHLLQLLAAAVCSTWKDHTALSVQRFQFTDNAKVQSQIIRVCTYFIILWPQRPEPLVFSHGQKCSAIPPLILTQACFSITIFMSCQSTKWNCCSRLSQTLFSYWTFLRHMIYIQCYLLAPVKKVPYP